MWIVMESGLINAQDIIKQSLKSIIVHCSC